MGKYIELLKIRKIEEFANPRNHQNIPADLTAFSFEGFERELLTPFPATIKDSHNNFTDSNVPARHKQLDSSIRMSRVTLFATRGVPLTVAERLIYRLAQRDQELDDRRSCAECGMHDHGCMRGLEPFGGGGVMVLHRCKGFTDDNF